VSATNERACRTAIGAFGNRRLTSAQQRHRHVRAQSVPEPLELDRGHDVALRPEHRHDLAIGVHWCAVRSDQADERADGRLERDRVDDSVDDDLRGALGRVSPGQQAAVLSSHDIDVVRA
jgi:hypothetical protein